MNALLSRLRFTRFFAALGRVRCDLRDRTRRCGNKSQTATASVGSDPAAMFIIALQP